MFQAFAAVKVGREQQTIVSILTKLTNDIQTFFNLQSTQQYPNVYLKSMGPFCYTCACYHIIFLLLTSLL